MAKERIEWIDIAKGITILLVIVGHGAINGVLRGIIFFFPYAFVFYPEQYNFSSVRKPRYVCPENRKGICSLNARGNWNLFFSDTSSYGTELFCTPAV